MRLTGRKETRRSLREWCAVFTATIIMVLMVLVAILLTATLILRSRDAGLQAPGKYYFVDGGKYSLHMHCVGNATTDVKGQKLPTVLLEGGYNPVEDTFEDWVFNAHQNGSIPRYCFYDRPGLAWSDNAPSPHSAGMTATALTEALVAAGENGPYILVSTGIGGIYSRIFSSRQLDRVHGIMLIETLHEDSLGSVGDAKRGFLFWARGIISPLGYDRLFGAIFLGRSPEDRVYGRDAYMNGKFIKAKLQENLVANSLTKDSIIQARSIQRPKTPLVVVSSGVHNRKDPTWEKQQRDLTTITDNLVAWDVVEKAPHHIWNTLEGRTVLEARLEELVNGKAKSKPGKEMH